MSCVRFPDVFGYFSCACVAMCQSKYYYVFSCGYCNTYRKKSGSIQPWSSQAQKKGQQDLTRSSSKKHNDHHLVPRPLHVKSHPSPTLLLPGLGVHMHHASSNGHASETPPRTRAHAAHWLIGTQLLASAPPLNSYAKRTLRATLRVSINITS
jgi:hypothetical protein